MSTFIKCTLLFLAFFSSGIFVDACTYLCLKRNNPAGNNPEAVKTLQTILKNLEKYNGPIDGKFGAGTEKGLKSFQEEMDIKQDGVLGNDTTRALEAASYANIFNKETKEAVKAFQKANNPYPNNTGPKAKGTGRSLSNTYPPDQNGQGTVGANSEMDFRSAAGLGRAEVGLVRPDMRQQIEAVQNELDRVGFGDGAVGGQSSGNFTGSADPSQGPPMPLRQVPDLQYGNRDELSAIAPASEFEKIRQAGLREEAVKVLGFYPAQMEGPIASVGKNSVCYESGNCQYNGPGIIADAFKKSADFVKGLVTNENDLTSVEVAAQKVAEAQAALDLADAKNVATSWSNPVDKFRAAFDAAQKEKALSDAKAKYENALAAKKQTLANQEQDAQQDYRSQFSDLEPTTVGLNRSFLNQTRVDAENALQNAQDVINGKAASVVSPDTNRELRPVDNPIEKAYLDAQSNLDNARNNLRNAESKLSNVGNSNTSDVWAVQDARQAEIDAQKKFDEAKANYTKTFEQYQKQFNEPEPTTLPDKLEGFANSAKNINTEEGGVVTDIDLEKFNCPEGKNCQSKPTAIVGVCKIGGGDCKQIQMTPAQALKAKVGSKFVEPKNSFTPINIKSTLTDKVKDDPKNPGQKIPQAGSLNEEKVDPANKDVQLKPGEKIEFTDVF